MPARPAVDRSTLRLSEVARHVVIPEGIVDTLWFEVEERCREFGDRFDVWQDGLGQVALGIREDGTFAATVGGITFSIPRQVAKTFIVMRIVVALCTLFPNLTVLWTAHRTRTATNTFQKMKALVLRKAVRGYLKPGSNQGTAIRDANGEQEIPFANGSTILFGAREQGFGRGFDEVDIEVFDEAQILTIKALEDMVAATNQSRWSFGALLFYMGTPPRPTDPGEMFTARRSEALQAKGSAGDFGEPVAAGDSLYIECSADPEVGKPGGPSLDDPRQVELANPSYPHRTPPVSVARLRKNLPDEDSWRREGLGVWDEDSVVRAIPTPQWSGSGVQVAPDGVPAYGVKFSVDGHFVALSVCVKPETGPAHVELVKYLPQSQAGALVDWLAPAVGDRSERWRRSAAIVVDGKSGAGAFEAALRARKVPAKVIVRPTADEYTTAHKMIADALAAGEVTHFADEGQSLLDDAVKHAVRRDVGKLGGWGWGSSSELVDITPLDSVTLAHFGALTSKRKPGRKQALV